MQREAAMIEKQPIPSFSMEISWTEVKQDGESSNHAFDSLNNVLPGETTLT